MLVLPNHDALRLAAAAVFALFPTWQPQFLSANSISRFGNGLRILTDRKYENIQHKIIAKHQPSLAKCNTMYNTIILEHYLQEQLRQSHEKYLF